MSYYTCDDCGEHVNCHDDNHGRYCPGPALRRGDVAEMIRDALADVAERLANRAAELREVAPNAANALLLVANEIAPECDRSVEGKAGEVVLGEGVVEPRAASQCACGRPSTHPMGPVCMNCGVDL